MLYLTSLILALAAWMIWHLQGRLRRARQVETSLREELEQCQRAGYLKLSEEENRQRAVFNSMVEGLLILDEEGRVQFANPALGRLFELPGDLRGRTLLEALRQHELQMLVERSHLEGQVTGFELQLPGNPNRTLQVNASTVRARDNTLIGTVLVFHDLSRIKQLEGMRREFVANVSHELRTPLSLIKGYVETLLDGAKDDPTVATRFLQTIEKHADRLTFLIDDLLTISQLESGQVAFSFQELELHSQAEQVRNELASRASEKQIQVVNEVPAGLTVRVDADRFQQVLFNLVDNAIKYGRTGGSIRLGGRLLPGDRMEGWVADDGPGIPQEAQPRIFERFYRVDRARSRDQGGTGLGLSIVKHIVQSHGGEIRVQSELGKGTIFTYTLPVSGLEKSAITPSDQGFSGPQ